MDEYHLALQMTSNEEVYVTYASIHFQHMAQPIQK